MDRLTIRPRITYAVPLFFQVLFTSLFTLITTGHGEIIKFLQALVTSGQSHASASVVTNIYRLRSTVDDGRRG